MHVTRRAWQPPPQERRDLESPIWRYWFEALSQQCRLIPLVSEVELCSRMDVERLASLHPRQVKRCCPKEATVAIATRLACGRLNDRFPSAAFTD